MKKFVIRTYKKPTRTQAHKLYLLGIDVHRQGDVVFVGELSDEQAARLKESEKSWVKGVEPAISHWPVQ